MFKTSLDFNNVKPCFDLLQFKYNFRTKGFSNTKSTDAQGILKPKSVIPREAQGMIKNPNPTSEVLQIEVLISRRHQN